MPTHRNKVPRARSLVFAGNLRAKSGHSGGSRRSDHAISASHGRRSAGAPARTNSRSANLCQRLPISRDPHRAGCDFSGVEHVTTLCALHVTHNAQQHDAAVSACDSRVGATSTRAAYRLVIRYPPGNVHP